jgi:hypothetical protein
MPNEPWKGDTRPALSFILKFPALRVALSRRVQFIIVQRPTRLSSDSGMESSRKYPTNTCPKVNPYEDMSILTQVMELRGINVWKQWLSFRTHTRIGTSTVRPYPPSVTAGQFSLVSSCRLCVGVKPTAKAFLANEGSPKVHYIRGIFDGNAQAAVKEYDPGPPEYEARVLSSRPRRSVE